MKAGRKKLPATKKRRNFGFSVSPEAFKFLKSLDDRNFWLERVVKTLITKIEGGLSEK